MTTIEHIDEPRLIFGSGEHICPRRGIFEYGVYDQNQKTRRQEIYVGAVGTNQCVEFLESWLERCRSVIASPSDVKQENLRLPFCGFTKNSGFKADLIFSSELSKTIKNSDIKETIKIKDRRERLDKAIELYYENIKFLAQNRNVDIIVCVIPTELFEVISSEKNFGDETLDAEEDYEEFNFRRALKAKAMHLAKPLQLIRQTSIDPNKTGKRQQDDATLAWNLCTALYYKSGPTIPWKLKSSSAKGTSCAVGIAFYRSRDRKSLSTSLAQIFDELGNGLILRGTPIEIDKNDSIPRLTANQAYELLTAALSEYRVALGNYPARVVIHKSSNFNDVEIEGLRAAANDLHIDSVDFVTVMDSRLRLYRNGNYPPYRGTLAKVGDDRQLLYTRGSVWYYQTYTGMYVPQPLELRIVESDESPNFIAEEVLGLTKMNWNNTQLDGKYPVTIGCARKVGEILKYLPEAETPQVRYGYYM
tara:strand:+ start:42348 stop:43772 length:1425 start_codon:yes stop_codon:yes gene_type:complete